MTAHDEMLRMIQLARTSLNPEPIIETLAGEAVYEAQAVLQPLEGRDAIADYLRERFAFFEAIRRERDLGRMRLGRVDLPAAAEHPCLVLDADGERQALWVVSLSDDRRYITRVDILTAAPSPSAAWLIE
ncbi:UNVERIFIED_CONTAM: hypothetical protein K0B97_03170 [Spiribacter pallidus]